MKSILVPLDGSAFAEQALPTAVHLAQLSGAAVTLVLAHRQLAAVSMAIDIPVYDARADEDAERSEAAYLEQQAARLKATGLTVNTALVGGPPGETLTSYAERGQFDLLVMVTHGRGPMSRFWLGSVADYLIRHVTVPVLLLRPQHGVVPEPHPIRSIMVPLDLSDASEAVIEAAGVLARLTGARLLLVSVVEPGLPLVEPGMPYPVAADGEMSDELRASAQRHLNEIADRLRARGLTVEARVAVAVGAGATIVEQAVLDQVDLIAMATHGDTGFRRALLGSVTDKVVRGATVPVLVVRPAS